MKNETIETYTKITIEEAAQLQRDGWKNFVLGHIGWGIYNLDAIAHCGCPNPFYSDESNSWYPQCAKVTELDPCVAPDGCPELEPWMAYIGHGPVLSDLQNKSNGDLYMMDRGHWTNFDGHGAWGNATEHYAIDVRTAWAQENFPIHCRIRNYQDAFEEEWERTDGRGVHYEGASYREARRYYELGQANPK